MTKGVPSRSAESRRLRISTSAHQGLLMATCRLLISNPAYQEGPLGATDCLSLLQPAHKLKPIKKVPAWRRRRRGRIMLFEFCRSSSLLIIILLVSNNFLQFIPPGWNLSLLCSFSSQSSFNVHWCYNRRPALGGQRGGAAIQTKVQHARHLVVARQKIQANRASVGQAKDCGPAFLVRQEPAPAEMIHWKHVTSSTSRGWLGACSWTRLLLKSFRRFCRGGPPHKAA